MRLRSNPPFNQLYYFCIIQLLPEEIEGFFSELKATQKLPLDYLLIEFEFIGKPNGYIRDRINICMRGINPSMHIEWARQYCIISNNIPENTRHIPVASIQTHPTNQKSIVLTMRDLTLLCIPHLHSARNIFNSDFDLVVVFDKGERRINTPDDWVTLQYDHTQKCFVNKNGRYYDHLSDWTSLRPNIGVISFPDFRLETIRNSHHKSNHRNKYRRILPQLTTKGKSGIVILHRT